MTHGQLKGALLEYLIRRLLGKCGFTTVSPDGHYIFAQAGSGLFYINGKGAAHDADVLMEPPIQMPFSYPSRILFECKAYDTTVGLGEVRNVLGLRYDINEFEIVTDLSIAERRNNRRANYAISNRKRYNYQVGLASVEDFSKPAFEFAANNKIPLISLRWFLSDTVCDLFNSIDRAYMLSIPEDIRNELYSFLKDKRKDPWVNPSISEFIILDSVIGEIIRQFNNVINRCYVGLIETGDLIFLFENQENSFELLQNQIHFTGLRAQIHYYPDSPDIWLLELLDDNGTGIQNPEFKFHVPQRIMRQWKEFNLSRNVALDLKEQFFSRIFIFTGRQRINDLPFFVANIDNQWLNNLRDQ